MFKKFIVFALLLFPVPLFAAELQIGNTVPSFKGTLQNGKIFAMDERKNKGWTILYFYPKADTPGCTKQACAFRDAIEIIRNKGAEIYGISADTVEEQKNFHEKYKLQFDLIADSNATIINLFGTKMPLLKLSKRWTFIIDPELKLRWIEKDVDPALDAKRVADELQTLQNTKKH